MVVEPIECYIMNLNTDEIVMFNVEVPQSISQSYTANFSDQATRGRSTPFKSYENSGPKSISFSVTLALDYRRDLVETVKCLEDMLKPAKGVGIKSPRVKVRIGKMFNITAVPTALEVEWSNGYKDGVYRTCDCSFSFDQVEDKGTFADGSGKTYKSVVSTQTMSSKSQSATDYNYGDTYNLASSKTGYYTAAEALANKSSGNPTMQLSAGTYYIYNKSKGMINISKTKGTPGGWISP